MSNFFNIYVRAIILERLARNNIFERSQWASVSTSNPNDVVVKPDGRQYDEINDITSNVSPVNASLEKESYEENNRIRLLESRLAVVSNDLLDKILKQYR